MVWFSAASSAPFCFVWNFNKRWLLRWRMMEPVCFLCIVYFWSIIIFASLPLPAPSASLGMTQRARSSTQRSTVNTSWASTCPSTWAYWWRRMRRLTRGSSPASSRTASPQIWWVDTMNVSLFRFYRGIKKTLRNKNWSYQNLYFLISGEETTGHHWLADYSEDFIFSRLTSEYRDTFFFCFYFENKVEIIFVLIHF